MAPSTMSLAWPSNRLKNRPSRGMSLAMKFIVVVDPPSTSSECSGCGAHCHNRPTISVAAKELIHCASALYGGFMSRVLVFAAALLAGAGAHAQEVALSFTAAQVQQGRAVYDATCVMCHGANLDDGPLGAPLKGDAFMRKYGGKSARALFDTLRTTMPTGNPGSLSAESYATLTALILSQNRIIPGDTPLPTDPQLLAAMQVPAGGFSFMAFSPYTARAAVDRPTPLASFNSVS